MFTVEEFISSPSEELLDLCTKEQLLKIAEHYDIDVSSNMLKERQKAILRSNLIERNILAEKIIRFITSTFHVNFKFNI